ncbi:MAG TPA: hypothetical protein VFN35_07465, partial [Ktedonobacteraceae bacterium]|nr:hypothetical protein [Ktedonobacteraceae bacterium]
GFFDASFPPNEVVQRHGHERTSDTVVSEYTLPALDVNVPDVVPLNQVVSVLVLISLESISIIDYEDSLALPQGAVIDIVMWARPGLVFEGNTEGQLVIPMEGETAPIQFRLRGIELGLRTFRICAFCNRQSLGVISLSVQVLQASETEHVSHQSKIYPLQPLDAQYPGLALLTLERHASGKAEIMPHMSRPDQTQARSALPKENAQGVCSRVVWQDCDPELLVHDIRLDQGSEQAKMPTTDRLVHELNDLLGRLFSFADVIMVSTLTPGFSGTKVLKILPFLYSQGGGRWFVVKFGNIKTIEREYDNYRDYVYPSIKNGYNSAADRYEHTHYLGGIIYTFVGTDIERIQDFGSVYRQNDFAQLELILNRLFWYTCENWYRYGVQPEPLNLTEAYQEENSKELEQSEQLAADHLPAVQFQQELHFASFRKIPGRRFANPFRALTGARAFVRSTYVSTTHGDFSEHNILVDERGYSWLIDFYWTGRSHILRDVATLDAVTRFQLLAVHEATLDEFLAMEEVLYSVQHFGQLEDLPQRFVTNNPALLKAFQTALYLRMQARKMVERNPQNDIREYYIALLYITLDTLRYYSLPDEQRERALLSASLLIELLGVVKEPYNA